MSRRKVSELLDKDCPFSLDCIKDLPRYVGVGHYQTTSNDTFYTPLVILSSGSNGKVGILSILPCRLGGRQAPTSFIPSFNALESLLFNTYI